MRKHLLSALLAVCLVATAFAQQGKVYETRTVKSKILGMERSYSIYLPVGYEEGDGSYPVLYFAMEQDGKPVNPMDYFGDI